MCRGEKESQLRGGGSCRCYSTTVSVGFRLVLPACQGKIGVSYASSAASHSLLHLYFLGEKKSVLPFSKPDLFLHSHLFPVRL